MTDRELLELAAKAAGMEITWAEWNPDAGPFVGCSGWDPLTHDGDALRLAVKIGLKVCVDLEEGATRILNVYDGLICMHMHFDGDQYAATRRAIVRAAAEIGKAMP